MQITTTHPASSYGVPVILDAKGAPMDYAPGIRNFRAYLDLSRRDLAEKIGVSKRTVEGWENGFRMPNAASLNAMAALLK